MNKPIASTLTALLLTASCTDRAPQPTTNPEPRKAPVEAQAEPNREQSNNTNIDSVVASLQERSSLNIQTWEYESDVFPLQDDNFRGGTYIIGKSDDEIKIYSKEGRYLGDTKRIGGNRWETGRVNDEGQVVEETYLRTDDNHKTLWIDRTNPDGTMQKEWGKTTRPLYTLPDTENPSDDIKKVDYGYSISREGTFHSEKNQGKPHFLETSRKYDKRGEIESRIGITVVSNEDPDKANAVYEPAPLGPGRISNDTLYIHPRLYSEGETINKYIPRDRWETEEDMNTP